MLKEVNHIGEIKKDFLEEVMFKLRRNRGSNSMCKDPVVTRSIKNIKDKVKSEEQKSKTGLQDETGKDRRDQTT